MNPRLPSEVTYKWKNMLLRCTKPNILQDRASELGSSLEELQTWQSLKMWQSPVLAGSCFSSIENLSLWIRGKCIMLSDVCFREPFWMARVAPCDVLLGPPWELHSASQGWLLNLCTFLVLSISYDKACLFKIQGWGKGQGANIW